MKIYFNSLFLICIANVIVDTINPTIAWGDAVATGPVQSDLISIKVTDTNPDAASYRYGFSDDAVCDVLDLPNLTNSFVS